MSLVRAALGSSACMVLAVACGPRAGNRPQAVTPEPPERRAVSEPRVPEVDPPEAEPTAEAVAQREEQESLALEQAEPESRDWSDDHGYYEQYTMSLDIDGDSQPDQIEVRCSMPEDSPDELTLTINGQTEALSPDLSDMIGCYFEVVPDPGPGHQVWVTAQEHDEVGASEHTLFFYRAGAIEQAWQDVAYVDQNGDGSWEVAEEYCDEDAHESTTTTTRYWLEGGSIESKVSSSTEAVEPGDCEQFDP